MYSQFRSSFQTIVRSVTKHTRLTIGFTKLSILSTLFVTASFIPTISFTGIAHADVSCSPDSVNLSGSSWLNGSGVNVCSADEGNTNVCVPVSGASSSSECSAGYVWSGTEWQCVELVNRLYLTKGWTTATWSGNGNTLVNNVPSGLTKQNDGSISYLNPGDVITFTYSTNGHAGIINTVGSSIEIINQNTSNPSDVKSYGHIASGTSLSAGNADIDMTGWAGYDVQAVVHHQSGNTASSALTPASISFNGNLNVFKVGGDDQVYQNYWNGSSWSGFASLGGTFLSNPAVIVNGSALNIFERGQDGQIYNEYNSGSGWSGWASLGSHQMKGNPTVMFYGSSLNVFALDTSNVPYEDTWTSANGWTGWNSNGNTMASDPVAVSYGGNLHLIYRGGDNKPYDDVFNGTSWGGFGEIDQGSVIGNPTALSYSAEGELDVYFGTSNNQIWKDTNQGSGWGTWTEMATGSMTGDPYIMAYNNDLQVFSRDTSNNIETRYWSYSNQTWSSWQSLGGSSDNLASDPFAYQYSSSELDLFANDNSANDYHDTSTSGSWSGFSELN